MKKIFLISIAVILLIEAPVYYKPTLQKATIEYQAFRQKKYH